MSIEKFKEVFGSKMMLTLCLVYDLFLVSSFTTTILADNFSSGSSVFSVSDFFSLIISHIWLIAFSIGLWALYVNSKDKDKDLIMGAGFVRISTLFRSVPRCAGDVAMIFLSTYCLKLFYNGNKSGSIYTDISAENIMRVRSVIQMLLYILPALLLFFIIRLFFDYTYYRKIKKLCISVTIGDSSDIKFRFIQIYYVFMAIMSVFGGALSLYIGLVFRSLKAKERLLGLFEMMLDSLEAGLFAKARYILVFFINNLTAIFIASAVTSFLFAIVYLLGYLLFGKFREKKEDLSFIYNDKYYNDTIDSSRFRTI